MTATTTALFRAAKRMNRAKGTRDEQPTVDAFIALVEQTSPWRLVVAAWHITVWRVRRWWTS